VLQLQHSLIVRIFIVPISASTGDKRF